MGIPGVAVFFFQAFPEVPAVNWPDCRGRLREVVIGHLQIVIGRQPLGCFQSTRRPTCIG